MHRFPPAGGGKSEAAEKYSKDLLAIRLWMEGSGFHVALAAMEFARSWHTGLRKDLVTPQFAHQVYIANYIRTLLPCLMLPEETLATVFTHDVCEDHDVPFEEISERFGPVVGKSTRLLTKKHRGVTIPYDVYFALMAEDPVASIVKPADRGHNIFTMEAAGWGIDKQSGYLGELEERFYPMIKKARNRFTRQVPAYQNVKTLLAVQATHIRLNLDNVARYEALLASGGRDVAGPGYG